MFGTSLLASVLAALLSAQTTGAPQDPAWTLEVTTPTYSTDGKVTGASASFKLAMNQPLVFYPHAGKSLCESSSASPTAPSTAGNGWHMVVVPLRNAAGALVLQLDWKRMWERGGKPTAEARGSAQVTLRPGERILLDYISAGERALSPNMAAEARAVTGQGCDAIGMGLEIGLASVERTERIEANLWLVRTLPDGTEQSQRQVIRARVGSTVEYFFDDVTMSGAPIKAPGTTPAGTTRDFYYFSSPMRTQGKLSSIDVVDGAVRLNLIIEQYIPWSVSGSTGRTIGGSTTFPITVKPDEVLSFQVPKITDDRLSLRIQVKRIR